MNDPMIIAAAIVLVIASIGSTFVQVINAKAAADDRRDAKAFREMSLKADDENDHKNNKIIEQGTAIHTLTNSNLSKVSSDLAVALVKISGLEHLINERTKTRNTEEVVADTVNVSTETVNVVPVKDIHKKKV